ncbi:type IV secretion system DNA-binding domain-containing protein [Escherichia coli]|nr:type IV secretion system DNA-binding domain-containing protein [Escherichia coli]EJO0200209.1 type IV secretion system DNA-binding domain-containing protein [Escherichia coli]HAW0059437.1 type IV secretion system DNA-binding domain-containing protein [Escherichia coli]
MFHQKRKQYLWLGIVVVGAASAIGGALYLSDVDMSGNGEAVAEQEPVPDMTGVVDTTFDDKVRQHATTEMQVTAAQMQKQYEEIRRELDVLNKQRGDDQRRIEKLGQDNAALAEQVKALGANPVTATGEPVPQTPASPPGPEGEPQPGNTPVSFPPQGSVAVPPPTAFYPGNGVTPPPQVTYQSVPVPIRDSEIQNFCLHGTVGAGKSEVIRRLANYARQRGDMVVIYDRSGEFVKSYYDPSIDKILNPLDARCAAWDLWKECLTQPDFDNTANTLIPMGTKEDPFWQGSGRTIFAEAAYLMRNDPNRSYSKLVDTLLSIKIEKLRTFLRNSPAANLVEEKIEKTAISIRAVLTNYVKAIRYLQGIEHNGEPFTIRDWMRGVREDQKNGWLFISSSADTHASLKPVISMWLSIAIRGLLAMGENRNRRVWFFCDELTAQSHSLTLRDAQGETQVVRISSLDSSWSLFRPEKMPVADGERLRVTGKIPGLRVSGGDRLQVASVSEDAMTVVVPGRAEPATLPVADSPFTALKLENGWVETPGHSVSDSATVFASVTQMAMTVLTVGLVSCAGKSLPRFWPGDFFPVFYACHLAVLGVLAL